MTMTGLKTLDHTIQLAKQWLQELQNELNLDNEEQAWSVFEHVIQTLRDRLEVGEATDFAAQLPLLFQGVFYHGWQPNKMPEKIRNQQEFLDRINEKIPGDRPPQEYARAVFTVINKHVSPGEVHQVRHMLPAEIQQLWPNNK